VFSSMRAHSNEPRILFWRGAFPGREKKKKKKKKKILTLCVFFQRILTSVQPGDHKRSFFDKSGRYVFHYMVKEGVTFLCFATKEHKTAVCFAFLDEISKRFKATYDQGQIESALAYSPQFEEFARVVEQEMNRFGHMKFADNKIAEVNEKVEATKNVMKENVQKVIERGDNIETLIEKTDILVQKSDSFRVNTKTLERNLWWKNVKIWIILILVVLFLIWLIFSLACGFDFACLRGGTQCIHQSASITYRGRSYTYETIESSGECRIPHTVHSDGLRIATTCGSAPLRLTPDHLVVTKLHNGNGFVPASALAVGDTLFADFLHQRPCHVLSIAHETDQTYFGLNCLESVVVADNVLVSTFGKYHRVPALFMSYAGHLLGIDRASRIGDALASMVAKFL
jgi:vesicle-associated membrane protein 7